MFIQFGATWKSTIAPPTYCPIASDLGESTLTRISKSANKAGTLRTFMEAFVGMEPLLADVLHKLDRRSRKDGASFTSLPLTGWQSYGRPEVLEFNRMIEGTSSAKSKIAVMLPCARARPYRISKTHRRIWRKLETAGYDRSSVDSIVVSSIGIVPERFWNHPVAIAYDSGVPDIYRVLRLMRSFFRKVRYDSAINCLEFAPYSDCLSIIAREGLIGKVRPLCCGREKRLPRP